MTATVTEENTTTAGGVGRISRVIGPVVDVEFSVDTMPEVYNLLKLDVTLNGETKNINLEKGTPAPSTSRSPSTSATTSSGRSRCSRPTASSAAPPSRTPVARSPCPSAT